MSDPPSPPRAPAMPAVEGDLVLDALWKRVLEAWDDDKTHGAFIEHCRASRRLAVAAARYRAETDPARAAGADEARVAIGKKRLAAIALLAMAELAATRTPEEPPERVRRRNVLRVVLFVAFAAMVTYALYRALAL